MSDLSDEAPEESILGWKGEDLDDLRRFLVRMFGSQSRQSDIERARWLFVENPNRSQDESSLWLLRNEGEIVAMVGAIPFRLKVGDRRYLAMWGVDATSDPAIRDTGIFYEFVVALYELRKRIGVGATLGLGSSEDGYRFIKRYGFRHVANIPFYIRPVDEGDFVRGAGISAPFGWAVVAVLRSFTFAVRRLGRIPSKAMHLAGIDQFDWRVNELWSEVSRELPVSSTRDLTWLSWRFDSGPHKHAYRRYYLMDGDRVVGYLVLREATWHGRRAVSVVDYLAEARRLPALFTCAVTLAHEEGAAVLTCRTIHPRARGIFRSLGFFRRAEEGHQLTALVLEDGPPEDELYDPAGWFVTAADSDVEV